MSSFCKAGLNVPNFENGLGWISLSARGNPSTES